MHAQVILNVQGVHNVMSKEWLTPICKECIIFYVKGIHNALLCIVYGWLDCVIYVSRKVVLVLSLIYPYLETEKEEEEEKDVVRIKMNPINGDCFCYLVIKDLTVQMMH